MKENRFYVCTKCGNIAGMIHDAGIPLFCCGEKMKKPEPFTEATHEKHLPCAKIENGIVTVDVGSLAHPQEDKHSILWVYLQTDRGGQRKTLKTGEETFVSFALCDEKPLRVYAYCNLHGLWMTELNEQSATLHQEGGVS